ncbi:hypothetical protein DSLASN_01590 [Desulfoluna limicola]|uniref:Uncharacterized protein n=1 Tax=Desulfoluna limicola TaxID=2810562 RepID=A0ABN6EVZ3_9BACT|nr:hypothetical protein [Desulfoluna limicola]BCS94527.1 hypothetical protein DSLASN_01590 [Desulfoluna limicola]
MENLWPTSFEEINVKPAKQILDEQAVLLPKLTGDMVYAQIAKIDAEMEVFEDHYNDFCYTFVLKGKFLNNYSFKVFNFSHEIALYPIKIHLDELLAKELNTNISIEIRNEAHFISILGKTLNSNRIKDVVGSIIKLSSSTSSPMQWKRP